MSIFAFSRNDEGLARLRIDQFGPGRFAAHVDENARRRIEWIVNEARLFRHRLGRRKFAFWFCDRRRAAAAENRIAVYAERRLRRHVRSIAVTVRRECPTDFGKEPGFPGCGLANHRHRMRIGAEARVFGHLRSAGREGQSENNVADNSLINFPGPSSAKTVS